MAIGAQYLVRLHVDVTTKKVVFDSLHRKAFTHDASLAAPTTTLKTEDYPGTHADAFTVQYSYPIGTEPVANAHTLADFVIAAVAVVDAAVVAKTIGGGAPSVQPSI